MNPENRFFRIIIPLLIIATIFATAALARVGGGQRYGSGGSGSSGNGGDGLGILIYFLLRLCIEQPCVGIPLVIIIIIVSIIMKKQKTKKQFAAIQQAGNKNLNRRQNSQAMLNAMNDLKERDPSFSEDTFTGMVVKAFMELQRAWSEQDLSKSKRFISDGVLQRFSIQLDMQKAQGFRNNMEDSRVHGCEIVSVESNRHFDTIHVKMTASGTDTDIDLNTGRKIRSNYTGTFVEFWSFLRRPGAQTLAGRGLVEGVCPNCGAPLELSETGRCAYCDALVTSGEYDWVLTEITQSAEWGISSNPEAVPGYASIAEKDTGFNLQSIEDTVSVIFWRYIQSYFENRADPMHKVSLDSCTESIRKAIANTTDGDSHLFFKNAAVGAVEVQEITTGSEYDRVAVLVKWSASNCWLESSGKIRGCGPQTIRPQLFTLVRRSGVSTIASQGLHSAHCTGCGAPYTGKDSGQCEYCGRPLNDGSGSWVLESITAFTGARVNASRVSPVHGGTGVSPDIVLLAMAGVMFADGRIDPEEMKTLEDFASHRGISRERLDVILATVSEKGEGIPAPRNSAEAMEILRAMIRMSLSDGTIDEGEKAVLEGYSRKAGLSAGVVSSEITRQRKKLYREVKKSGS